jgi:hypothetical protein
MLWVPILGHQSRHRLGGGRTDTRTPVDQARRRPFHVGAVCGWHVGGLKPPWRLSRAWLGTRRPRCISHRRRDARFQYLADQRVRHAVAVTFDLDW